MYQPGGLDREDGVRPHDLDAMTAETHRAWFMDLIDKGYLFFVLRQVEYSLYCTIRAILMVSNEFLKC